MIKGEEDTRAAKAERMLPLQNAEIEVFQFRQSGRGIASRGKKRGVLELSKCVDGQRDRGGVRFWGVLARR